MALKMNVPEIGKEAKHKGAYVKITNVNASSKIGDDPFIMVTYAVFENKAMRDKAKKVPKIGEDGNVVTNPDGSAVMVDGDAGSAAVPMSVPGVDMKKFPYDAAVMTGDPFANAYALTKAHADFTGAEDV